MARLARAEVFSPDEVAVVHVMNRVVRRCFLLGTDSLTGKNYDHRGTGAIGTQHILLTIATQAR
ncbi:hypothetical protein [Schlesneria sp. T3-172]|uniref:hypothetical protein n=1 Tax=Schlesneria sphaerica TaxID=3373610 RepID=UPI0037CA805F